MATYTLISSNVLSSTTASVTFSSIPATYTDLVLKTSLRSNKSNNLWTTIKLQVNGSSSAIYSYTELRGTGSGRDSTSGASQTSIAYRQSANGDTSTANTFSNNEFYFPNYTGSANKVISVYNVQENNDTTAYVVASAGLVSASTAISSITLADLDPTWSWLAGSSFYLYGISNA
jgi:hypothetical protein